MPTQIYLIRHGETAWSLTGQHTGRTDVPLTENGQRQAIQLRERLQGLAFTHVLTSPLQRASRTCGLAGFGSVAKNVPDLVEWDYGDYEGKTSVAIREQQPDWNIFQQGCPHGESVAHIAQRADRVLAALRLQDGTVAVFSHGHFLRALAVRWIGLPLLAGRHFTLDTASISILGHDPHSASNPVISVWNSRA